MASLENVQGQLNSQDVNLAGMSASNDPIQIGADALARGRAAGFSDEETLGVLSRRRRHQRPIREDNRQIAEARQRFASITSEDGTAMPEEVDIKLRSLPNERVQFEQDGRERDQSVEDAYYGRDENEFTRWNKDRGTFEDVYIPDGKTTPDDLRDQALLRSWGINKKKTGQEKVRDKRGRVVTNQQGEVMMRNTYDFENVNETTSGQGWQGGGGRAAADAYKQVELAVRMGKISPQEAAPLLERLRRTADPQFAKEVEAREGRKAVIKSSLNFDPLKQQENREIYADQIAGAQKSVNLQGVGYIPGSLTRTYEDPERGISITL